MGLKLVTMTYLGKQYYPFVRFRYVLRLSIKLTFTLQTWPVCPKLRQVLFLLRQVLFLSKFDSIRFKIYRGKKTEPNFILSEACNQRNYQIIRYVNLEEISIFLLGDDAVRSILTCVCLSELLTHRTVLSHCISLSIPLHGSLTPEPYLFIFVPQHLGKCWIKTKTVY